MKEFLSRKGVPYVEKDVSMDQAAAAEMVSRSGQRGVPVITMDNQVVVGFDRARIEQILQSQSSQSTTGAPSLGIAVADASKQNLGGDRPSGAYVGRVTTGSAGERLGLKRGDIVVELNGVAVNNASDLETAVATLNRGDRVRIAYKRVDQWLNSETTV